MLDAPFFTNQLEIIRNVAKSLPIGYKLFVKEQAAMVTRSWRSIDWYKQLAKIPNVVLIHHSLSMKIDLNQWYRPKVDRVEFKRLCERSDWSGFKHIIIFFSS